MNDSDIQYNLTDLDISLKKLKFSQLPPLQRLSTLKLTITLISTSMGIGLLSIPISTAYCGIVLFISILIFITVLEYNSSIALLMIGRKVKVFNYPILIKNVLGKNFLSLLMLNCMFISVIVTISAYSLVIQQCFSMSFGFISEFYQISIPDFMIDRDSIFWVLVCNLLMTPMIYLRRYKNFGWISYVSFFCLFFVVGILIVNSFFISKDRSILQKETKMFNESFLFGLPIIIFAMVSNHTLLDFVKEIHQEKWKKIKHSLNIQKFTMLGIYLTVGLICYLKMGQELISLNYGNILLSYEFNKKTIIFCNILIVIYIAFNNLLKFKPAKDILTVILRENYRESLLWNVICISLIQILQISLTCLLVHYGIKLHCIFFLIGILCPIFSYVFPFIAFYKVFYFDVRYRRRRIFYCGLLFAAVFMLLCFFFNLIFNYFFNNQFFV